MNASRRLACCSLSRMSLWGSRIDKRFDRFTGMSQFPVEQRDRLRSQRLRELLTVTVVLLAALLLALL